MDSKEFVVAEKFLVSRNQLVDETMYHRADHRAKSYDFFDDLKKLAFAKLPENYNPHEALKKRCPNIRDEQEYSRQFSGYDPSHPAEDLSPPQQEEYSCKEPTADEIKRVIDKANSEPSVLLEGLADHGNPLLDKLDQLYENLDDVFGESPNEFWGVIQYVKNKFPARTIEWRGKKLVVDGAVLKTFYKDHLEAHMALKKAAGARTADRIIGTLLVKKLRKLF